MKSFLIISAISLATFVFGQADTAHFFKLLRVKDSGKLSSAIKSKEFHKAISFRDATTIKWQSNKRSNWIAPIGMSYYEWEGVAQYNSEKDTIELWKSHIPDKILLSYSGFVDLNNDKRIDIIFSNIYDQFLKTQSNWTDIYFNLPGKYIPISLKGYLVSFERRKNKKLWLKTVEQPAKKTDLFFLLHSYEVDANSFTAKEIATERISRLFVRQQE